MQISINLSKYFKFKVKLLMFTKCSISPKKLLVCSSFCLFSLIVYNIRIQHIHVDNRKAKGWICQERQFPESWVYRYLSIFITLHEETGRYRIWEDKKKKSKRFVCLLWLLLAYILDDMTMMMVRMTPACFASFCGSWWCLVFLLLQLWIVCGDWLWEFVYLFCVMSL